MQSQFFFTFWFYKMIYIVEFVYENLFLYFSSSIHIQIRLFYFLTLPNKVQKYLWLSSLYLSVCSCSNIRKYTSIAMTFLYIIHDYFSLSYDSLFKLFLPFYGIHALYSIRYCQNTDVICRNMPEHTKYCISISRFFLRSFKT